MGTKFQKHPPFYANPSLEGAFFVNPNGLPRRHVYGPEFNTEAVRRAEPRIAQCQDLFFRKLDLYAQARRPVNMTAGLKCLMVDGVTNFIYSKPYGALDADDFRSDILKPMYDFTKMMQWPIYFPRVFGSIFRLMNLVPTWALEKSLPGLVTQTNFVQVSLGLSSFEDAVHHFQQISSLRCPKTMRFLLWHVPVKAHNLP